MAAPTGALGLAEIGAQQLVKRLPVAFGKSLHSHQRTVAAQERKNRHQEHPPLGKANAATHPAVRKGLEEADQIACSDWGGGELGGQGAGAVPAQVTVGAAPKQGLLGKTSNRPWLTPHLKIHETIDTSGSGTWLPKIDSKRLPRAE